MIFDISTVYGSGLNKCYEWYYRCVKVSEFIARSVCEWIKGGTPTRQNDKKVLSNCKGGWSVTNKCHEWDYRCVKVSEFIARSAGMDEKGYPH